MDRAIDPLQTIDAKLWADEFMATKQRLGDAEFDHAMMLGWFANAIMRGYDEGKRLGAADAQATIEALQARVRELEEWVQDQSTANLETMRHTDEMQSRALEAEQQLTRRTAELARVRKKLGETKLYIQQERANRDSLVACVNRDVKTIKELRTLILALPKVEAVPMTEAGAVNDPERCPRTKHVDGKSHGWLFWGDDPYIKCDWCGEIRDALTGRVAGLT